MKLVFLIHESTYLSSSLTLLENMKPSFQHKQNVIIVVARYISQTICIIYPIDESNGNLIKFVNYLFLSKFKIRYETTEMFFLRVMTLV